MSKEQKQYIINDKYLGNTIFNPRDLPGAGTVQNVQQLKDYPIDPNLVINQIASEGKFIIQSRGLQSLKTLGYEAGVKVAQVQQEKTNLKTQKEKDFTLEKDKIKSASDLREQQQEGVGSLGLPIFDVIQFGGDSSDNVLRYSTKQWDTDQQKFIEKNIEVQQTKLTTCLFNISQKKNIVTTNIQGRSGPVFEYIGLGGYDINIKGVLVSPYRDVYPTDLVSNLVDILEAPVAIKITSNILNSVFNILNVVVMDYNMYSEEGMRNVVHFEINCVDENPFEIKNNTI